MSFGIRSEGPDGNQQPFDSIDYNRRLLDSLFSEDMSEGPWSFVKDYILRMLRISEETNFSRQTITRRAVDRPLLNSEQLRGVISHYLESSGWKCALQVPVDDTKNSHKFDVLAEKDFYTIVVEVKPDVDVPYFDQLLEYISEARSNYRRVRVFLGTDIANVKYLSGGDDITDMLMEFATRHQLGVIFANQEQFWAVPAEFLVYVDY